ncbi:MAG: hypothetical protein U1E34_11770 [Amaricoccus sp.]
MTPDGSDFSHHRDIVSFADTQAILLHGGRALLLFEGLDHAPPRQGRLVEPGREQAWTAECWRLTADGRDSWCGLAVLDALPAAGASLAEAGSLREWRLAAPPRIDIAPQPLADLVRRSGVDSRAVFGFLVRHLLEGRRTDTAETQAHQAFATGFFTAAAERDGFIEILGSPDGGGLFAQGWSMSLAAGPMTLASVAGELAVREVEVALFQRDDILPPGHGFCFFGKGWRDETLASVDAVFFENEGRLLRLDVVNGAAVQLGEAAATAHVAGMLPRLIAPDATRRAFKRVCRPCYHGIDTLSGTSLPIGAAFDSLLQAPNGSLLAIGWLLDPLRRVDRVLIKSTRNLYAPINASWCALPRADLNKGFGSDPRFAGLLDDSDILHGFIVQAPAERAQTEGADLYLELVLDDESCLFKPVTVTPFETAARLPQLLGGLSPHEPELKRIVEDQLAPFLASVRPSARAPRRGAMRPIMLGTGTSQRDVAAILPFRSLAELQPVLGLLADTPDARRLALTLVAARSVATDVLTRLGDAFCFYGLEGSLVLAAEQETIAGRLDAGTAATDGRWILSWTPSALPKGQGWLDRMVSEAESLGDALLSPALTYEDGSIYFGGIASETPSADLGCAFAGYGAEWLPHGAPRRVAAGAPEIALIGRTLLDAVGGFSGHLFSDAFTHVDLADRLRRAGAASYCSGAVEFWMLDDPHAAQLAPFARLMQQVDASLIERRSGETRK